MPRQPTRAANTVANTLATEQLAPSPTSTGRKRISPAERWELIRQAAHQRAQKREFVGGFPHQDLLEAEREVDAVYETDFECLLSLRESDRLTDQLRGLLACYGFDQQHLNDLLEKHYRRLQELLASNRQPPPGKAETMNEQTRAVRAIANEAVEALQSLAAGRIRTEALINLAEVSMKTLEDLLATPQASRQRVQSASDGHERDSVVRSLLGDALDAKYKHWSVGQLADAPVKALRGVTDAQSKRLEQDFAVHTIRDLANHPEIRWASGICLLAEANQRRQCASSITSPEVAGQQDKIEIQLLKEAFDIQTIQDLQRNHDLQVASAIVVLADSE